MLTLITGGAASGKSEFAERLAAVCPAPRAYLATMRPTDDECARRIEKHRAARAGRGFLTVEQYENLMELRLPDRTKTVLLECLSNLLANEQFSPGGAGERAVDAILTGIDALCTQADDVFIVSNEIFSDGVDYDPQTLRYIAMLGELNRALAARADEVFEVICGIAVTRKGGTTQ